MCMMLLLLLTIFTELSKISYNLERNSKLESQFELYFINHSTISKIWQSKILSGFFRVHFNEDSLIRALGKTSAHL